MGALRAVEKVHSLLLLGRRIGHVFLLGVRLGVAQSGRLAERSYSHAMPHADLRTTINQYR